MRVTPVDGHCIWYGRRRYLPGDAIDMEEAEAVRLITKARVSRLPEPEAAVPGPEDTAPEPDAVIASTPPLETMRVRELKQLLKKLGVEYPKRTRKSALIDLARANTAEPGEV